MLDQGDHPAGHEPRGPDRGPGSGHLADLYDTAPVGDVDAASRPGRRYLVRLGPLTGVNHDLDAITLHRAASRRLNLHSNIYLVRSQVKRPPREPDRYARAVAGTTARSARKTCGGAGSVRRERGIDLADPGQHAAADVHRVGEAGVLDDRQRLRRAGAALAVQHDPLVLRQPLQGGPGHELALRDERRTGNGDDLVLVRLADVDEEDVVSGVQHGG